MGLGGLSGGFLCENGTNMWIQGCETDRSICLIEIGLNFLYKSIGSKGWG